VGAFIPFVAARRSVGAAEQGKNANMARGEFVNGDDLMREKPLSRNEIGKGVRFVHTRIGVFQTARQRSVVLLANTLKDHLLRDLPAVECALRFGNVVWVRPISRARKIAWLMLFSCDVVKNRWHLSLQRLRRARNAVPGASFSVWFLQISVKSFAKKLKNFTFFPADAAEIFCRFVVENYSSNLA
jgi:hypothetical protein